MAGNLWQRLRCRPRVLLSAFALTILDHAQLGVGWAEGGRDASGRPDLASQLYDYDLGYFDMDILDWSPGPIRFGLGC